MIIVSQDKDVIVNFDNVENIWINNSLENNKGKFEIRAESYSSNMIIGEYETEETAKEVLKKIVEKYENCNLNGSGFVANEVFYMPKEKMRYGL